MAYDPEGKKNSRVISRARVQIAAFFNSTVEEQVKRLPRRRRELGKDLLNLALYEATLDENLFAHLYGSISTAGPKRQAGCGGDSSSIAGRKRVKLGERNLMVLSVDGNTRREAEDRAAARKARLEKIEKYGVPYHPSRRYLLSEPSQLNETMRKLYEKKWFLKSGLFSVDFKGILANNRTRERFFRLRYPAVFDGCLADTSAKDFQLPYDLSLWLQEQGGLSGLRSQQSAGIKPARYVRVSQNSYLERPKRRSKSYIPCDCDPHRGDNCGEKCYNRCMFIECLPGQCPCGDSCTNRRFQKKEFVRELQVYWTGSRGFGVRTLRPIAKGTLVTEYQGEVISVERCHKRMAEDYSDLKNYYMLSYADGEVIDGTRKGSDARFINHSCSPNCAIEKWVVDGEFAVGVVATEDIDAGTELCYNYRFRSFGRMQKCLCESKVCRGFIGVNQKPVHLLDACTSVKRSKPKAKQLSQRNLLLEKQRFLQLREILKELLVYRHYLLRRRVFLLRNYVQLAPPLLKLQVEREKLRQIQHKANQGSQSSEPLLSASQLVAIGKKLCSIEVFGEKCDLYDLFSPESRGDWSRAHLSRALPPFLKGKILDGTQPELSIKENMLS